MEIIRLIRPWQWVKNLFVFLPMFFAGRITDLQCWKESFAVFIAVSLIASAIYCVNDVVDVEENRRHPRKRQRPVAKGTISKTHAIYISAALAVLGFGSLFIFMAPSQLLPVALLLSGYYIMNLAYCLRLKRMAIVDVFCISTGFVLRVFAGGEACDIWVSPWLICLTFLLTLFLAFAKRRDDLIVHIQSGMSVRQSSQSYNLQFMNMTLGLLGAITMVCYIIYTVQPDVEQRLGSQWIYLTSVFVLAGILRYLQIAVVEEKSGNPTSILLKDRFIQECVIFWFFSYIIIIYF